jgi:hypothetical protein
MGQPFAISAIASTCGIVLHAPQRYHRRPQPILACYTVGIVISAPISLVAALCAVPVLIAAAVSALIIVATPVGRIHPPTACIPLAIVAPSLAPLTLVIRWTTFTVAAAVCLAVLWLITTERSPVRRYAGCPCPARSWRPARRPEVIHRSAEPTMPISRRRASRQPR